MGFTPPQNEADKGTVHMAQTINQLTAIKVQKLKAPGYHADGGGLHLQISQSGKSWIFTYRFAGRAREMGLGSLQRVSLAEARDERDKCNRLLREHIDPIEHRRKKQAAAILKAHGTITFAEATDKYLVAHRAEWSPKHFKQWQQTLTQYVVPELGKLLVSDITTGHIVRVLEPIWPTVNAERLRGRIESILSYAATHGFRQQGDNPARWRGCLDHLLAKPSRSRKREHHAALPYAEMPAFMAKLRAQTGAAARALELCVLVAARSNEVRRATPAEIGHAAKVWVVPAERTKTHKEFRIPMCKRALELAGMGDGAYLFPGQTARSIDSMAMRRMLERLGYGQWSVHGMRSSFRDWAAERTNYPNHVVEMALGHAIGNAVEAAYRRGDLFAKRAALMTSWAEYCASSPAKRAGKVVVPLRA
jgi:integrase